MNIRNMSKLNKKFLIDGGKPTATLTSTDTIKSSIQYLTGTCSDNVWVVAYYWWTNSNPTSDLYTQIESTTSLTVTGSINDEVTLYFICKDAVWNTWQASKIFRKYTTYSYLDKINWTQWSYNTTNYSSVWTRGPYYIPNGTVITLSDIYYTPPCSTLQWWAWGNNNPSSLSTATTVNVNARKRIHLFFNRNKFDLTLQAWTGIESVTWAWNYKYGASIPISAVLKPWYTWAGWTKTAGTELTTFTPATNSQNVVLACGTTTLKATATLDTYTITYNLNSWTNNASNPSTYTVLSWAITLQAPTRTWYTFKWWTWSNGTTAQTSVTIPAWSTGNRTYNAKRANNIYNAYIDLNDGIHSGNNLKNYDYYFMVQNPTRAGYTFSWWKITWMDATEHTIGDDITTATSIDSTKETWFGNLTSISGATVYFLAQWIDTEKPVWTLTTTNTVSATSQRLTWTCTDTVWVTAYYLWTSSSPSSYTSISSTTSYTTWMNITASWTYYLFCKDAAWNVSTWKSITYVKYQVKNMLDYTTWNANTYNTTNYAVNSTTPTATTYYVISWWTSLTLANLCTSPWTRSTRKQTSVWNPGTSAATSAASANAANQTYACWYARTLYDLTLTKNTWIETLYYKVNGASSFANTWTSAAVKMKAWSDASVYAVAANCYTYTDTSSTNPQSWTNITTAKSFSPTATENTNNITYNMNWWTNNANNPATYKITQLQ